MTQPQAPRVSVYITSYNQKGWLREAIDSVLAQTVAPYEIIIVDDASTDGSQALIRAYRERHPRLIKPIFHAVNQGIARSRIDALNVVCGDYVTYVDGDDRFLPDKLEQDLATLASNPDAELVYSNFYFIDAEGARTALWAEETDVVHTGWIFPHVFAREFPKHTLFRNELVSYEALQRVGFHDPALDLFEDFELRIRLSLILQTAYCDRPLAEYRRHAGSLSHADLRGHLRALDYIYNKNALLLSVLTPEYRDYAQRAYQDWMTRTFLPAVERETAVTEALPEQADAGEDLIFLLGLPWSGSTLLQQALGRHPQIHALDADGALRSVIDTLLPTSDAAASPLRSFVAALPEGDTKYLLAVRRFAGDLCSCARETSGKRLCLVRAAHGVDHVDTLRRLFPQARFVFLLRHPGAALEAAINAWSSGTVEIDSGELSLQSLQAQPARLLQAIAALGPEAVVVRYEDLASQPVTTLRRLCARLGLRVDEGMRQAIEQFAQLEVAASQDAWLQRLVDSGNAQAACDYLETLGVDTVEGLGYAYTPTLERLAAPAVAVVERIPGPVAHPAVAVAAAPTPREMMSEERVRAALAEGEQHFAQGNLDAAERCFRAVMENDANNTEALNNLGVLHWQRGDAGQAMTCFAQGLSVAPHDRGLVLNTVGVLVALQSPADAAALCRAYLERYPDDAEVRAQFIALESPDQAGYRQAR